MDIKIFNVGMGQCAMVVCPNKNIVMIDAGHNSESNWRPSDYFSGHVIECLVISNYDEDHASDLVNLSLTRDKVKFLRLNDTVDSTKLKSLKDATGGMDPGIQTLHDWMKTCKTSLEEPDLGNVIMKCYYNPYETFKNSTNNLSVATFFHYGDFTILFPGDLELAGWEELLKRMDFQDDLKKVTILVASHHGRESGYCEEVFEYCNPELIIISDGKKKHETQKKTTGWYEKKASGVMFQNGTNRFVLTTRNDGNITIDVPSFGDWGLTTGT